MIVGIGVDVVDIARFESLALRQPTFVDRILTAREQLHRDGTVRSSASLAARFAAKEAVAKAMGGVAGMRWHDCEILTDEAGRPRVHATETVAATALALGIAHWHVSLTHDGGNAIAYVIAEG